jgi:methionyl-tRNA formyltransferase
MRLIFMGTPDFAVPTLIEIVGRGHEVVAVYTRAAKPAGRGMELQPTPVEREARRFGVPVLTPKTLRSDAALEEFRAHKADAAVVVAYGLILPIPILEAVPLGCFNVHASLLPRWRGAAPINRAITAGDAESGVCVMKMAEGLDIGPVALREAIPIAPDMTAGELHDALAALGARMMPVALGALQRGTLQLTPQADEGVTYAAKIAKGEMRIDWSTSWKAVHDHCRGLSPFPGAWFELGGQRIKALRTTRGEGAGAPGTVLDDKLTIACQDGAVQLLEVQRAGKQPMRAEEFLRGARIVPGRVLQ